MRGYVKQESSIVVLVNDLVKHTENEYFSIQILKELVKQCYMGGV